MSIALAIFLSMLMLAGALLSLIAAIGVLRFPDLYTRMHAASKAGALGAGLLLLALAVFAGNLAVVTRALAGFLFILLTTPISAHLLARAAYLAGHKLNPSTGLDRLRRGIPQEPEDNGRP